MDLVKHEIENGVDFRCSYCYKDYNSDPLPLLSIRSYRFLLLLLLCMELQLIIDVFVLFSFDFCTWNEYEQMPMHWNCHLLNSQQAQRKSVFVYALQYSISSVHIIFG